VQSGDTGVLAQLLAEAAVLHTDGGGRKAAARNLIRGRGHIMRLYAGLARKRRLPRTGALMHPLRINGLPGFVSVEADGTVQTVAFEIAGEQISAIYVVSNPDKLGHLAPKVHGDRPPSLHR